MEKIKKKKELAQLKTYDFKTHRFLEYRLDSMRYSLDLPCSALTTEKKYYYRLNVEPNT